MKTSYTFDVHYKDNDGVEMNANIQAADKLEAAYEFQRYGYTVISVTIREN